MFRTAAICSTLVACALLGLCGEVARASSTVPLTQRRLAADPQAFVPGGDERFLVVVFLGVECPLAKLYAGPLNELAERYEPRGVGFVGIDSNEQDSEADMEEFARTHSLRFPLVKDRVLRVADRFGAKRNPEVFVVDLMGKVRYRGRIDDRYQVGLHRDAAASKADEPGDLARALDELTNGRDVSVPETTSAGCLLTRPKPVAATSPITYTAQIAPLLHAKCVRCHQPGEVGPMSLTDYHEVVGWAAMIDEVVGQDRMPPWHAERGVGHFKNDASLTVDEKRMLREWLAAGCPRGDASSGRAGDASPPVTLQLRSAESQQAWQIGRPDAIVSIPEPFTVPASGTIEYQYFDIDPGFAEDRWIAACEVRPTNRAVLHHCNVFLRPAGSDEVVEQGSLGSYCLTAMAAGTPAMQLPLGMAKRIPAGWHLVFVVHYVAIGTEQVDQLSLGLKFAQPNDVQREVATRLMLDEELEIPPGAADHRVEHMAPIERDLLLVAMFPHLHLRGKSFRYEATYPDGTTEVLLNVPRWDFAWQHRYELAEPKSLPRGTTLRCVAHYDNSAANRANPAPNATVRTGPQSDDEMFNGYYDVATAEADYPARKKRSYWFVTTALVFALVLLRRKGRAPSLRTHLSRN
jgi:peroxiredoxin